LLFKETATHFPMFNPRHRPILIGAIALVAVWVVALTCFAIARNAKVTAEKVRAYLRGTDLKSLSGDARAQALRKWADQMNALSGEERRLVRMDREWSRWFEAMTEDEKAEFIESTLPSGFKEMLSSFEQLEASKRKRAVDDALRRLKQAQENPEIRAQWQADGLQPPPVRFSPELQIKITTIGLKTFYSQSSAQTKAELAPLLEEIQRSMEMGRIFR
jgi:hypothetical protein